MSILINRSGNQVSSWNSYSLGRLGASLAYSYAIANLAKSTFRILASQTIPTLSSLSVIIAPIACIELVQILDNAVNMNENLNFPERVRDILQGTIVAKTLCVVACDAICLGGEAILEFVNDTSEVIDILRS